MYGHQATMNIIVHILRAQDPTLPAWWIIATEETSGAYVAMIINSVRFMIYTMLLGPLWTNECMHLALFIHWHTDMMVTVTTAQAIRLLEVMDVYCDIMFRHDDVYRLIRKVQPTLS